MTTTYMAAAERDTRRTRHWTDRIDLAALLVPATSCVAVLAIALAYAGRTNVFAGTSRAAAVAPVNLNAVAAAPPLEAAMETVLSDADERRLTAQRLFRFLGEQRQQSRALPNVGAIAPLFSQADFAKIKPLFTVRTTDEFRRQVVLFTCIYILAFHAAMLVWRWRRIRSDPLLVAVAHLLTAIGFAVLVSRADPLRDSLTFVRFAEGTVTGIAVMTAVSLVDFGAAAFMTLSYLPLLVALSLSMLLILFGSGPGTSGAKVNLGPVQPIEAIRLLLALFLAGLLRAPLGIASGHPQPDVPRFAMDAMDRPAARRVRPAGCDRCRPRARLLLPSKGSGSGPVSLLRLSRHLCCRARPGRDGDRRARAPDTRLLCRLSLRHLAYARRTRAHVAIAMGQRRAGRRPGHACDLGAGDRRFGWNRPRSRRHALPAGRPHRSDPRGDRRGARRDRPAPRRCSVRALSAGAVSASAGWRETTTDSSSPPR